jgi:hypothetical protein
MSTSKERDPTLSEVLAIIDGSGRSAAQIDRAKGVAPSTLKAWRDGKTRRPMNISIDMTLRACGFKRIIVKG